MDNKEIIYELINCISSSKKGQLRDDTNLLDTQILDSLGIAQLVAGLEANFNIEFDAEDIVPENFMTIVQIQKLIKKYQFYKSNVLYLELLIKYNDVE